MNLQSFVSLKDIGRRIIQNLKDRSSITLRLWTDHCEYIVAQRCRRGQQMTSFYYSIWGELALKELLGGIRKQIQRHLKGVLLSSVGLYVFDWESQRIRCNPGKSYITEIDFVEKLKRETLQCPKCGKRKIFGEKFESIDYCICPSNDPNSKPKEKWSGWEPYLEGKSMIIWRKLEKSSLFSYKVYAKYDDITASDFLHVQTDIEYRKEWDDTAVSLHIVDSDPMDETGHVIYWEMKWPRLFANRDYVYYRKYLTYENALVVYSCSTVHPTCPVEANKQRVDDYWSYMVIKARSSLNEPGVEFVLTYFDDPGLAIPSTITSWVAQKQMPDYLNKLYLATKKYAEHKKVHRTKAPHWSVLKTAAELMNVTSESTSFKTVNEDDHQGKPAEENVQSKDTGESGEDSAKRPWWSYLYPYYDYV